MSTSHKKVIVRLCDGTLHRGYLDDGGFLNVSSFDLLLPDGKATQIFLKQVVHIAYVRNFNFDDSIDPERVGFRSFPLKPRAPGVWVRVQFSEGDTLEGIVRADGLALLDSVLRDSGVFLEPPDPRANTQRLFIPRSAMARFELLGISRTRSAGPRRSSHQDRQSDLFGVDHDSLH